MEYNLHDTYLIKELDEHLSVMKFLHTIKVICGCEYSDTAYFSNALDMYILHMAYEKNILLPDKKKREEGEEKEDNKYSGGHVEETKPGLWNNVVLVDLTNIYPAIILSLNMSPETKSLTGKFKTPEGIRFKDSPDGLLKEVLERLIAERKKYRILEKEILTNGPGKESHEYHKNWLFQFALKRLANSAYGVFGYQYFRLYDLDIAKSITSVCRKILVDTMAYAKKEFDYDTLYTDTDGIWFHVKDARNSEDFLRKSQVLLDKINKNLDNVALDMGVTNHQFLFKIERLYKNLFLTTRKKRYAGKVLWEEKWIDYVQIKGYDYKRSDCAKVSSKLQKKVLEMVLDEKSNKDIEDYVVSEIKNIKDMKYSLQEIGIPKSITKNLNAYANLPSHVKGAEWSNANLNSGFFPGSKPMIVYFKQLKKYSPEYVHINKDGSKEKIKVDCVAFDRSMDVSDIVDIDWERMLELLVVGRVEEIFNTIGANIDRVKGLSTYQISLANFM